MAFFNWSRTAASNATADSTVNWAEGQSPSSVNDSARAMMAALAKYRDDIAGAITTGGTSTAYTVTSYSTFDTLAHLDGAMIAFTPHTTNGATVTLNVDGLGAKPLRFSPSGDELAAATLIQGSPYICTYNNSNGEFYLQAMTPSLYTVPLGAFLPYAGTTAPNSKFALPFGQAISRSTYATLFSLVSTTFGTGDGSTTFNILDLRGRVAAGKDDMGGSAANRLTNAGSGITGTNLGASGGAETVTLITGNLPPYTPAGTIGGSQSISPLFSAGGATTSAASPTLPFNSSAVSIQGSNFTFTGTAQGGTSTPVNKMPHRHSCSTTSCGFCEMAQTLVRALLAFLIAFLLTAALKTAAIGHDSWIFGGGYRNGAGEWCCGAGDCFMVEPVRTTAAGYLILALNETVPFAEAQPSPDGKFWRCKRPDGSRRCFFAPPPST
jgi:microcystin-dependent protein